jgi:hypothetical protein
MRKMLNLLILHQLVRVVRPLFGCGCLQQYFTADKNYLLERIEDETEDIALKRPTLISAFILQLKY